MSTESIYEVEEMPQQELELSRAIVNVYLNSLFPPKNKFRIYFLFILLWFHLFVQAIFLPALELFLQVYPALEFLQMPVPVQPVLPE